MATDTDVASMMQNTAANVRKHATQFLALADFSTAVPTAFFGADGLPSPLPVDFRNLGYITTKGLVEKHDAKTDDTTMVQDLTPVRTDLSSVSTSFTVAFGEVNGWTKALRYAKPVSAWPATKDTQTFSFDETSPNQLPYYRAIFYTQDGVGANAVYRVKFYYKVQISAFDDETFDRSNTEDTGFTFTTFRDPVTGKFLTDAQSVPVAA